MPFSRELCIEQDDFREDPPKKYFRLSPGKEVRLRWAYFVTCTSVVKDPQTGEVVELHCTYDPATRGGDAPDGRKVKGTIHWVSAAHAVAAEVRLYDNLFTQARSRATCPRGRLQGEHQSQLAGNAAGCWVEPSLAGAQAGRALPVRAAGLFLRRPGLAARQAGLQPHRFASRHVGEDREGAVTAGP